MYLYEYTQRPLRRLHSETLCKYAARSTLGVLARKQAHGYGLMRTVNPSQVRSGSCKTKQKQTLLTVSMCSCQQEKLAQLISSQLTVCRKQKKRALVAKVVTSTCPVTHAHGKVADVNHDYFVEGVEQSTALFLRNAKRFACRSFIPGEDMIIHVM